jgi:hypothetical protein
MDLQQRKLNRTEWDSLEIIVSDDEMKILTLIQSGFKNVNIRVNNTLSVFTFLKIEYNEKMEDYLYNVYLRKDCATIEDNIQLLDAKYVPLNINVNAQINSADKIRLERNDVSSIKKHDIYEYVLMKHMSKLLEYASKPTSKKFMYYYFTLFKLHQNSVIKVNRHIVYVVTKLLGILDTTVDISAVIENSVEFVEKNKVLLKYNDLTLYDHQKEIFNIFKQSSAVDISVPTSKVSEPTSKVSEPTSKLVLYMAPTGTGKTLTPLGLSEANKILFVCAARHVGLALAKSAISIKKKIAFAFGCETADDIRLHNYAAKDYVRNANGEHIRYKGGNKKIDNGIGDNVEIMICDIKSFLTAMHYMRAFNKDADGNDRHDNIIVYWDEPTITLDYDNHEFHQIIKKNWRENLIPNMVLSSATLPKIHEISETIGDFKSKCRGATIHNIMSYDCKKSIPIVNKNGFVVLPHYLSDDYDEVLRIATHCENNKTLLRYFDLKEIVNFIMYVNKNNFMPNRWKLERYFDALSDINMTAIKIYYIKLLQNILQGTWGAIAVYFKLTRTPRITENVNVDIKGNKITKTTSLGPGVVTAHRVPLLAGQPVTRLVSCDSIDVKSGEPLPGTSGIYVTTKDAYTLTDGPTIFITNDVEKIANFCIQQANIPSIVMEDIAKKIYYNNGLNEKISSLENELEFVKEQCEKSISNGDTATNKGNKSGGKDSKKMNRNSPEEMPDRNKLSTLTNEINALRSKLKVVLLNDAFVPNKYAHTQKWAPNIDTTNCYTSNIDEDVVNEIMLLAGINDSFKILLMMGIGVFITHDNIKYTEIMKKLADEQKLYMIIASSDYIYGTNYQFCHGYLSKDLNLTQEKIIQAMGRIGRTNVQQNYTVRFRDDTQIMKLFTDETDKPEINNMNRLFNSETV